jgi:hypothetical protein
MHCVQHYAKAKGYSTHGLVIADQVVEFVRDYLAAKVRRETAVYICPQ